MLTEEKEFRTQLIRKIVGILATKDNQELVEVLADVGDPEKGYSRRALSELPAVQKALKLNIDQLLKFGIVQSGGILAGAFGPVEGLVRVKTIEALVKRLPHLDNEELIEILAQLTNGNLKNNSQEDNKISYED